MARLYIIWMFASFVFWICLIHNAYSQTFGFDSPATLNSSADSDSGDDLSPDLATDGAGNCVAVWTSLDSLGSTVGTDRDIFVSASSDSGAAWSTVKALNTNAASDNGRDEQVRIGTNGAGKWIAVWTSRDSLGGPVGTDNEIYTAYSSDNGTSWSTPVTLNTNAATDSGGDLKPFIATDGSGVWVVAWMSNEDLGGTAGTDADIFFARSIDNGNTWSAPETLNSNADSDSGTDDFPRLATDGSGNWIAVWQSSDDLGGSIGTDNDILVSTSADNGASWSAVASLNSNSDTDTGSDIQPSIATDGSGNWVVIWYSGEDLGGTAGTDFDVFVSRSSDDGANWSTVTTLNTNADSDTGDDGAPQVIVDGAGNWIAVWQSTENLGGSIGTDQDIFISKSTNDGLTWTAPATLNDNAQTDTGSDGAPQIKIASSANWVTVWQSTENLNSTAGTDNDILFSTSASVPIGISGYLID